LKKVVNKLMAKLRSDFRPKYKQWFWFGLLYLLGIISVFSVSMLGKFLLAVAQ